MVSPLISIIIPVYNAEKYLNRCLDSVIAQTFTNWECLLIDDGSKDLSGKICDEYASKDSRFRVFHKENGGVSSARNRGIIESVGYWVTFVDSDDWVIPEYLKGLIDCSDKSSFIATGYQSFGKTDFKRHIKNNSIVDFNIELTKLWNLPSPKICWYPWGKLFLNEILKSNDIFFDIRLRYSEDFCFVLDYMDKVDSLCLSSGNGYMYYRDTEAGTVCYKYPMNFDSYKVHVNIHNLKLKELEDKYHVEYKCIRNSVFRRLTLCFMTYLRKLSYNDFKLELGKLKQDNFMDLFLKILLGKIVFLSSIVKNNDMLIYILMKYRFERIIK